MPADMPNASRLTLRIMATVAEERPHGRSVAAKKRGEAPE